MFQLIKIKHQILKILINAFVMHNLVYCNSLYAIFNRVLDKLQRFAVRVVTGAGKYEHITPQLKRLHL